MARLWNPREFDSLYDQFICRDDVAFGGRAYHLRYRSRYKECIKRFAALAPQDTVDVFDVGGGQLALICTLLWGDRGVVADLPGPHLLYLEERGIETVQWNLCKTEPPFIGKFACVFFSEVIEHLPIPGYLVLARLRRTLKPGGVIICTTPNLYRLRNVLYMAMGKPIFDYFRYPDDDLALSHVLEYSRDHLKWQFETAGFARCSVEYSQMHHLPTKPAYRPLAWLGYPLHMIPRWRDNLVATAYAPNLGDPTKCIPGG